MSLITQDAKDLINESIGAELFASHLYRQVYACMMRAGYFGAAKWFMKEAQDELAHYDTWVNYVNDRGDLIDIPAVKEITERPTTLKDAIQLAYDTEKKLGDFYEKMYDKLEDDIGDIATAIRTQKFIKIQTQSIGEYGDFLVTLEHCKDDAALLLLDEKLGKS